MFKLVKIENANINVPEPEFLEATESEAFSEGQALVLSSGKLTKASGTTKPAFIAMASLESGAEKRTIPVCRVNANQVYEVPVNFSSSAVALVVGTAVTVDTDGLGVTDVTTNGVVTIVDTLDANTSKKDGDKILVRVI